MHTLLPDASDRIYLNKDLQHQGTRNADAWRQISQAMLTWSQLNAWSKLWWKEVCTPLNWCLASQHHAKFLKSQVHNCHWPGYIATDHAVTVLLVIARSNAQAVYTIVSSVQYYSWLLLQQLQSLDQFPPYVPNLQPKTLNDTKVSFDHSILPFPTALSFNISITGSILSSLLQSKNKWFIMYPWS